MGKLLKNLYYMTFNLPHNLHDVFFAEDIKKDRGQTGKMVHPRLNTLKWAYMGLFAPILA